MKKDKKWLLREFRNLTYEFDYGYLKIKAIDVIPLIEQLDEPEKVVIPQFVADHIEFCKSENKRLNVALSESPESKMVSEMGVSWEEASEIYARAWLDGYEVEKEKLYYVKLPNTNSKSEYLYLAQGNMSGDCWFNSSLERLDYEANACKHKFTEQEIKDYDERYWQFAVEVTE